MRKWIFNQKISAFVRIELPFRLNTSPPLTLLDRTSCYVTFTPLVAYVCAKFKVARRELHSYIIPIPDKWKSSRWTGKHTGEFFRVDCLPQSLSTRAIQMKLKILKMFCRGNHAATLVSCLSYFSRLKEFGEEGPAHGLCFSVFLSSPG